MAIFSPSTILEEREAGCGRRRIRAFMTSNKAPDHLVSSEARITLWSSLAFGRMTRVLWPLIGSSFHVGCPWRDA